MAQIIGVALSIINTITGQYTVEQVPTPDPPAPAPTPSAPTKVPLSWSFGPVTLAGYVEPSTLDFGVTPQILGISLGSYTGNFNDGLNITFNLVAASGSLKFFVDNEKNLKVDLNVQSPFAGPYQTEATLLAL